MCLPSLTSCMHCCSFTPNGTASEPALKQASSSFVSRPRGNERGELDVLLIMERTKSQSDSPVKVSLLQHHREQLSLINQRLDTDLQRIKGNIKREKYCTARTRDNQPCNSLRQAISRCLSPPACYGHRKHLLISIHHCPRAQQQRPSLTVTSPSSPSSSWPWSSDAALWAS